MSLLEIYKEKNKNIEWFKNHFSLGENASGKMFEYINTNFRNQKSFSEQFLTFLEIENKPRSEWPKNENHGQEKHKQHVINMLQSKLFKKDINGIYSRTAKGFLYGDFINLAMGEEEKWLINYLFLLNGYYSNRKNYIIHRVKEDLLRYLLTTDGITEALLTKEAKTLLELDRKSSLSLVLRNHFFYIHSFYDDSDFLITYFRSSDSEKEELAKYIEGNIEKENFECCISKKYQPGGNFNKSMLLDETKVFLLTLLFTKSQGSPYQTFIENFSKNITNLDQKIVRDYLYKNKNIFDPIFEETLELEDIDIETVNDKLSEKIQLSQIDTRDVTEEYIDETSEIGKLQIKVIYNLRKKQAKVLSNYKCALEKVNNCSPIYFTAKVNNKNYLELHHFIPREFRNDFSYSIEVLANYITLCPRCHRQIHLALDRERKHLINSIYEERSHRLKLVGLELDREEIYKYYKIDN
ncbi:MAG: hypothetical protein NTZ87_04090 [Candidatus Nomurabacteria bacterium]|nr:hypothetical protein [Candidatus Nomurabacteria bacterium]